MEDNFTPYAIIPKPRLDLSIEGAGGSSTGLGYGGRVGMDIPLENGSLNVGVSGQGYKSGKYSDFKATGIDAALVQGDNELRLKYEQMSPQDKAIFLNYIRSF